MMELSPGSDPSSFTRKRKLRHPRTTHACAFCRKRKTRCTGESPACRLCREEGIDCVYPESVGPPRHKKSTSLTTPGPDARHERDAGNETSETYPTSPAAGINLNSIEHSRRTSAEPPDTSTLDDGLHIGPTSGVSFLYRWQEGGIDRPAETAETTPLSSYGDVALPRTSKCPLPQLEEGKKLMWVFCM
jgi:Fungal Zn(2)-Cys(6) binuclear cluster domain